MWIYEGGGSWLLIGWIFGVWIWDGRLPWGRVSDDVWILEGIDIDLRKRGKTMILTAFIEK